MDQQKIETAVRMILEAIGENPDREGLIDTPKRVAKMYQEVFSGLTENPARHLEVYFNEQHEELVIVKDIQFSSFCEHHLIPFVGLAHIAYIPANGRVTGLSKLARVIDTVARRPQLQERITTTVADTILETIEPLGVMVIVEAEHMCMTMRGVKKPGTTTITSAVRGLFEHDSDLRAEALRLIQR